MKNSIAQFGSVLILVAIVGSARAGIVAVENVLSGQTFHLRQSTDLTNFQPLSPPISITATTPQPMAITVDRTRHPRLFFSVYAGQSPAPRPGHSGALMVQNAQM